MEAVARTWYGERSLAATYWLWFIVPSVVVGLIGGLIAMFVGPNGALSNGPVFLVVAFLAAACQLVLTYGVGVGVIRSARRSTSHIAWRWLAGGAAVIGMLWVPFGTYGMLSQAVVAATPAPVVDVAAIDGKADSALTPYQAEILAQVRPVLPHGNGSTTVLSAVAIKGSMLVYGYSVDVWPQKLPNAIDFKFDHLSELCVMLTKVYRKGELEGLQHRYFFKNGEELMFNVLPIDCGMGIRPDTAVREKPTVQGPGNLLTKFETDTGIDL